MTVISEDKKPRKQVSGLIVDNEEDDEEESNFPENDVPTDSSVNPDAGEVIDEIKEYRDIEFPIDLARRVMEMVNKPRWIVPVLPGSDLENLLFTSIRFSFLKKDEEMPEFKEVHKSGLLVSFERIMTDDAILNWKIDILDSIYRNSLIMMKLCAMKMNDDNLYILEILSIIFNHESKYHQCSNNYALQSPMRVNNLKEFQELLKDVKCVEQCTQVTNEEIPELPPEDEHKYAHINDNRKNKFIYTDLINCFGHFEGFLNLKLRFDRFEKLEEPDIFSNIQILNALLKPLYFCIEYLTDYSIEEFVKPIAEKVVKLILDLNDDAIKPESIKEWKSDKFGTLLQYLEGIIRKSNANEENINKLTLFRLNLILKVLQHASFNGRMNALNELNKLIKSMYIHGPYCSSNDRFEPIISWIKKNQVLKIVLKENLHQLQYVEKVEKLIRFMVKSNCMSDDDLDRLWDSQIGKHEAIVTNIHDLLAKLAYDFSPTQLHHLIECFQKSWAKASKRQRERLIDLIRRLAEEDKDGRMAKTALNLLWDLATKNDSPLDIIESALKAHVKILDFCSNQDRDVYRNEWLNRLIHYLRDDHNQKNAVSTMRQIKEILRLFQVSAFQQFTRSGIIKDLDSDHSILNLITNNLVEYLENYRKCQAEIFINENSGNIIDDKFSHESQIDERLDILRFLLNEGILNMKGEQLTQIWSSLVLQDNRNVSNAVSERDQFFKWFSTLMYFERFPFENEVIRSFFEDHFLKLDPKYLTLNGILVFDQIFRFINREDDKIQYTDRDLEHYIVVHRELTGLEYLWRCAMLCVDEDVFNKILQLLKTIFTNLGGELSRNRTVVNSEFIQQCVQILQSAFDTAKCLLEGCHPVNSADERCVDNYYEVSCEMEESVNKLANILQILCEFIRECDSRFVSKRQNPALCRMTYGFRFTINVNYISSFSRNNSAQHYDLKLHTNELIINLRMRINSLLQEHIRQDYFIELSRGSELIIEECDNYKTMEQMNINENTIIQARLIPSLAAKQGNISDIEELEVEDNLPGVQICNNDAYMALIINIGDLALKINNEKLRWSVNSLLRLLPPDMHYRKMLIESIVQNEPIELESLIHSQSPMGTIYLINVLYSLLIPCNPNAKDDSLSLLEWLIKNQSLRVLLKMIHFDDRNILNVFVLKNCESSPIRLIGLIRLLKIIYLILSVLFRWLSMTNEKFRDMYNIFSKNQHHIIPNDVINSKFQSICDNELKLSKVLLPSRKDIESFMKLAWCCSLGNRIEMMMNDITSFSEYLNSTERSRSVTSFNKPDFSMTASKTLVGGFASPDIQSSLLYGPNISESGENLINQPTFCSLECLSLMLASCSDTSILDLIKEKYTKEFITVLLLQSRNSKIRHKAAIEIRFILKFSDNSKAMEHVIQMFFLKLNNAHENPMQYGDVYNLLVNLLSDLHSMGNQLSNTESLLRIQLERLLETKSLPDNSLIQTRLNFEILLIGRLKIVKELLKFFSPGNKASYDREHKLIDTILDTFLFPSSKRYSEIKQYQQEQQAKEYIGSYVPEVNREFPAWATASLFNPICMSSESQKWALELLKVLVAGSPENMEKLYNKLEIFFYNDQRYFTIEWDYKPNFTIRSTTGYVGLKNAGATCYMNSIIQQLFMISPIRNFLLMVDAGPPSAYADYDDNNLYFPRKDLVKKPSDPKQTKLDILREVQMIFGNLAFNQHQFHTPTGFWKHFKFWGDEVNLREQHDALEFFTCLVDTLDEALSSMSMPKIFEEILVGHFADQKICKGCPHKYECEEKFFQLSVDIRNHENLIESLEQYVKGDLLEGDNAYYCEACQAKRDTVKRTCIKKLPLVLAIQLKRFDYDWERDIAVKFNDYFEFPNELDMAPYTVAGTLRRDHLNSINEIVSGDGVCSPNSLSETEDSDSTRVTTGMETDGGEGDGGTAAPCTRYRLKGVVVHGGQASGGHYYSFIREKRKFDSAASALGVNNSTLIGPNNNTVTATNVPMSSSVPTASNAPVNFSNLSGATNLPTFSNATPYNCCSDSCSSVNNCLDSDENSGSCWYRFDDTEVTEVRMDSEEMKIQWFGGEFLNESYDHLVKRVSMRRQKRWWSAYILFYERTDFSSSHLSLVDLEQRLLNMSRSSAASDTNSSGVLSPNLTTGGGGGDNGSTMSTNTTLTGGSEQAVSPSFGTASNSSISISSNNNTFNITKLPQHIEESITLQNIEYMHSKSQYSAEYFAFLKDLPTLVTPDPEYLPVKSDKIEWSKEDKDKMKQQVATVVSQFLFSFGLKTNQSIRGPAMDWLNNMKLILHDSETARMKFSIHAIFSPLTKVTEYLLESPLQEVRIMYVNLIRYLCSWSLRDTSSPGYVYTEFGRDPYLKDLFNFIKERYPTTEQLKLAHILMSIMYILLNKETNEYGSCANEYLSIFYDYPMMGFPELSHSLDINLATHVLKFCLDDYFSSQNNTNRLDITKLMCIFCRLTRCYDFKSTTTELQIEMCIPNNTQLNQQYPLNSPNTQNMDSSLDNPYCLRMESNGLDRPISRIRKIPEHLHRYLYGRTQKFFKRVVEDFYTEGTKDDLNIFLKFICYNNVQCSISVVENMSTDLAHSFIKNIKHFLEIFRTILDIDDDLRLKRSMIMIQGDLLDFASRFKANTEKRCYFIMKMIIYSINKLTEDEKRQMWLQMENAKQIHERIDKSLKLLSQHLLSNEKKLSCDLRNPSIESNEENSNASIERTNSSMEMDKIGSDMLSLYIDDTPLSSDYNGNGEEDDIDDENEVDQIPSVTATTGPPPYSDNVKCEADQLKISQQLSANEDQPPSST